MLKSSAFLFALFALPAVHAHGVMTAVTGANGLTGAGFGVDASTPRDGSTPVPFEQDTSIIRANEAASGKASACGRTKIGGVNDIATNVASASAAGLPSAASDGTVTMTLHQVNADGAGPYSCAVSSDATGNAFVAMTMTTNVPGFLSLSGAQAEDFPLVAQMPAGTTCTGGPNGNACIVRCKNSAIAGPFGGCVAVTDAAGAAAAGTNTTAAATAATAAKAAAAKTAAAATTAADTADAAGAGAAGAGVLKGLLGGALGGAKGGAKAGGLKGLLGGLKAKRSMDSHARMLNMRILRRADAGRWI